MGVHRRRDPELALREQLGLFGVLRGAESRRRGKREDHLERVAVHLEGFDLAPELGVEHVGREELQEGQLGVEVGDHDPALDFLAALERDAGDRAVARADLAHGRIHMHHNALRLDRALHCLGDRAHAADRQAGGSPHRLEPGVVVARADPGERQRAVH